MRSLPARRCPKALIPRHKGKGARPEVTGHQRGGELERVGRAELVSFDYPFRALAHDVGRQDVPQPSRNTASTLAAAYHS